MTVSSRRVRMLAGAVAALLIAQFVAGMVVNLYVVVPHVHPGARAGDYFGGVVDGVAWAARHAAVALAIHAVLGLALAVATLALLGYAVRSGSRRQVVGAAVGAMFTIAAGFNGASFLNYGNAVSSLLMAIFFIVALTAYLVGFHEPPRRDPV